MYTSIEARWFLPSVDRAILKWFESHSVWNNPSEPLRLQSQKERTDYYLTVDGYEKMSFKIREGKTEIKVLDESYGSRNFTGSIQGVTERWVKWGPSMKAGLNTVEVIFQNPEKFIPVRKKRLLLKYSIDHEKIKLINPESTVDQGCQVELTEIHVREENPVYSFAFESFGNFEKPLENFDRMVEKIHGEMEGLNLSLRDSYSYPVFLGRYR